jgi:AcrR family transcriptional regulator
MSQVTAELTTRQKILNSAKVLFSNYGFAQTSIEDIITSTGITKGAFYHYFESKESICDEIIDEVKQEYETIFKSLEAYSNPLEKLRTLITQILTLNSGGRWTSSILILRLSFEKKIAEKMNDFWDWYIDQYRQMIIQCRDSKLIGDKLSVEQQLNIIISFLTGSIFAKSFLETSADNEVVQQIIASL